MNKFDEVLYLLENGEVEIECESFGCQIKSHYTKLFEKALELGKLYKEFFDKLDIETPDIQRNTFEQDELSFNYVGVIVNSEELISLIEK